MENSRVVLKAEKDAVTMRRMGEFQTVMEYRVNETTDFLYRVPFGEMKFKIKTATIKNNLSDSGGELNFCYDLIASGEKTHNDITIKVEMM